MPGREPAPRRVRFVSESNLPKTCLYDITLFAKLLKELRSAGFTDVLVRLPDSPDARPAREFFRAKEDTDALLIVATNRRSQDEVRIVLVDGEEDVSFINDAVVGKVAMGTMRILVHANDPIRAFGLRGYFRELCRGRTPLAFTVNAILSIAAILHLLFETLTLVFRRQFFLASTYNWNVAWDVLFTVAASIVTYSNYMRPDGLALGPRQGVKGLWQWLAKPRIHGHPIVQLVFRLLSYVLMGLLGAFAARYFKHA